MTVQPEVSVIIPSFNRAAVLPQAIDSVVSQTFQDFEVIIVDDGSTDDTSLVIDEFTDPRIFCYKHKRNLGSATARNTGMRLSRGRYIAWLDSDDEWLPAKLEMQLDVLKHTSEDIRACITGYLRTVNGRVTRFVPSSVSSSLKTLLWKCELGAGSTLLFERELLLEIGYIDEGLPRYEDWDWLIRYIKNYDLQLVSEPLAKVVPSFHTPPAVLEQSVMHFIQKYKPDMDLFGKSFSRKTISRRYLDIATCYYFNQRNREKERYYLIESIRLFPFSPMAHIALADALLGTSLRRWASIVKRIVLNAIYTGLIEN